MYCFVVNKLKKKYIFLNIHNNFCKTLVHNFNLIQISFDGRHQTIKKKVLVLCNFCLIFKSLLKKKEQYLKNCFIIVLIWLNSNIRKFRFITVFEHTKSEKNL